MSFFFRLASHQVLAPNPNPSRHYRHKFSIMTLQEKWLGGGGGGGGGGGKLPAASAKCCRTLAVINNEAIAYLETDQ